MTDNAQLPTTSIAERIARVRAQRSAIMALPTEEKQAAIMAFDQPVALVHAFAEQDFLLLVDEIGPDNALEIIALASDRQWEHLVDARIWLDDRLDLVETTRWIDRLCRADAERTVSWLARDKPELLELYLFRNINIIVREPDLEAAAMPDEYFTFDDSFYMEIPELPPRVEGDATDDSLRQELLRDLLNRMVDQDHHLLQRILLETIRVLPAEAEEGEYRLRNVRMAEKGFLPFEEAVGIYQAVDADSLGQTPPKPAIKNPDTHGALSVPLYPAGKIPGDNGFARALALITDPDAYAGLQTEFAALCNRLIVADRRSIREPQDLADAVRKACGYLHLGLDALTAENGAENPARSAALIERHSLEQIFRIGYGRCLKIKWRAEKWRRQSWYARAGLSLTFWDEAWTGVLGGLFIKRPLFFDNYKTGQTLYREFSQASDLRDAEAVVVQAEAVDAVLALISADLDIVQGGSAPLTWKNLLLTCWLHHVLGIDETPTALSADQLRNAFDRLWPDSKTADFKDETVKAGVINWLSERTGLSPEAVSQRVGQALEDLFDELLEEYGPVRKTGLDPRFIRHFLIL
ncbi:MAG: hypothetical protein JEZ11_05800 [Desulfobacterales bacterium]|nr:hypothetical protein [Desulfobacterales bacterium]